MRSVAKLIGHSQDIHLRNLANDNGLAVISVGYRLAPEDPFPSGPEDCYDAAQWLVDHAQAKLGAPLSLVGGEVSSWITTISKTLIRNIRVLEATWRY